VSDIGDIGNMKYGNQDIKFSAIAAVCTSLIARQQQFAAKLTALRLALDAQAGAEFAGLGIFDQGYYNRLGFGTGSYEHILQVTPSSLNVSVKPGIPVRFTPQDWKKIHKSRIKRLKTHGALDLSQSQTRFEMLWDKDSCGYGYLNKKGELTHHFILEKKINYEDPARIKWMCYRNKEQLIELLALIKSFGDQVNSVEFREPPLIQMQDFISRPFWYQTITEKSKYENHIHAYAYWQIRILNLAKCIEKISLTQDSFSFHLELTDPIESILKNEKVNWKGVTGNYTVTLGNISKLEPMKSKKLPRVKASIGAFSRWWFGVASASSLATSDELEAPSTLLKQLDQSLCLPRPYFDWDF
jgi:predicted acetyltransferase